MSAVTLWILLQFSTGSYNRGSSTVVATFTSAASCAVARDFIEDRGYESKAICVPAKDMVTK